MDMESGVLEHHRAPANSVTVIPATMSASEVKSRVRFPTE